MINVKEISLLFESIEKTRGTKAKKELLELGLNSEYKEDLEKVLNHLFNPMISTGISKTSWNKAEVGLNIKFNSISELIEYIQKNNTGKSIVVSSIKSFSKKFEPFEQKFFYYLATKDINIGISTTTVSKYIHIPKFEIMLGERLNEDVDFDRNYILTKKLDGVNLTCFKRGESITFFTRQGKQVDGLTDLIEQYKELPDGVYFGEALYSNEDEAKDRKELYRLSTGELNSKRENKKISHWIFDYQTLEEWDSEKFITPYSNTINTLENIFSKNKLKNIKMVPFIYQGTGKEIAFELLKKAKKDGWEGLVLRYSSSVYQKKRSSDFIKLKPFVEVDLRITGFKEFKHPNQLGSFICEDDEHTIKCSVGSGFSKEQRYDFWKRKNEFLGKIVEVQTMEITENKSGQKSLRFPVFIRFRDDKNTTNVM